MDKKARGGLIRCGVNGSYVEMVCRFYGVDCSYFKVDCTSSKPFCNTVILKFAYFGVAGSNGKAAIRRNVKKMGIAATVSNLFRSPQEIEENNKESD